MTRGLCHSEKSITTRLRITRRPAIVRKLVHIVEQVIRLHPVDAIPLLFQLTFELLRVDAIRLLKALYLPAIFAWLGRRIRDRPGVLVHLLHHLRERLAGSTSCPTARDRRAQNLCQCGQGTANGKKSPLSQGHQADRQTARHQEQQKGLWRFIQHRTQRSRNIRKIGQV
jgi:hypothetical protein